MRLLGLGPALLAASLLGFALPIRAADFDKYLLDDTDGVLTVNVKQVVTSPAYSKHLQKEVERLLGMAPLQAVLRGSGFDPVKDIERVTIVMGRSLYPVQGEVKEGTPMISGTEYVIVQGNLNAALLKALADRAAKEPGLKVTEHKIGDAPVWQVIADDPLYVAMPEKGTVIISGIKGHVADALAKGTGKMKTQLKSKAIEDLLARLDLSASATWAATNDLIYATSAADFRKADEKPSGTVNVTHYTLGDEGVRAGSGSMTIGENLQATIILNCKDADRAGAIQKFWKEQFSKVANQLDKESNGNANSKQKLGPLVALLKGITITSKDQTVALKAQGSPQVIPTILKLR